MTTSRTPEPHLPAGPGRAPVRPAGASPRRGERYPAPHAGDEMLVRLAADRKLVSAAKASVLAMRALGSEVATVVRMSARDVRGWVRGVVWVGRSQAVAAIETGPVPVQPGMDGLTELCSDALRGQVLVFTLPLARLPMLWLWWAGPIEEGTGEGAELADLADVAAIDRRVSDAAEPLPGHMPGLAAMWSGYWREWAIRDAAAGTCLRYVGVPGHGVYAERAAGGRVLFRPRPSGLVWGDIVALYCGLGPVRLASGNNPRW